MTACSVTSRAELLLLYESEGKASIVGVEERVSGQTSCPSTGTAGCRQRQSALPAATSIRSGDFFFGFEVTGFGKVTRHDLFLHLLLIFIQLLNSCFKVTFNLSEQDECIILHWFRSITPAIQHARMLPKKSD